MKSCKLDFLNQIFLMKLFKLNFSHKILNEAFLMKSFKLDFFNQIFLMKLFELNFLN